MAHNYEKKERVVRSGKSMLFNEWHEAAGVTMEEFLDALRWLCDDPMPDGKLTRELACIRRPDYGMTEDQIAIWGIPPSSGTVGLHRLIRSYFANGDFAGFYEYDGDPDPAKLRARFEMADDVASFHALNRV